MISVEMEDVLAVLQLCKPYIIGIIAALVIGIVIMIACRRMSRDKRFLIRGEAAIAMVLAVAVCVNMICFGPMATLIGLATGNGTLSDETNEEAAGVAEEIMEDGIVLLKNESLLPLNETKKLNIFGWESINPAYGGAGSGGINDLYDIVSLNQGFENAGFSINQELVDFYNNYGTDSPEMSIQKQSWTLPEPPVDTYSDELIKNATAEVLQKAMKALLAKGKGQITKAPHGKITMRQLMKPGEKVSNIEITDQNIKAFDPIARKNGLDYNVKKIENGKPPTYLVSFRGKDIDVMTEAFREFTAKKLGRDKKPSIRKLLSTLKDKAAALNAQRDKVKKKDREVSL